MRICHVITRLIVGGAQENTLLTCAGLVTRGHDVTLIAGPETGPEGSLWQQADRSGATLVRLNSLRRNPHPVKDLLCLFQLKKLLRNGRFDVIHTHSSKAGILGRMAARRMGTAAIVHTIHGMSFNRTQSRWARWGYRMLERRVANATHAFVSVADAMTHQAVDAGLAPRQRFTTIYSGMRTEPYARDDQARTQVRKQWQIGSEHIVVGTVARLFRNKGYEEIIEAIPRMLSAKPGLRFVWIGDGAERPSFERQLNDLGVRRKVHLTGLVPPDEVPRLMNGFDIVLHASRWEGLPRALVQGLLLELPGVSFDNDGAPEVIDNNETGCLVPFGDTEALADAVIGLADSATLRQRLGQQGRALCIKRFSAQRMVDDIERLYLRLTATPH